jgi:hypothetical protein
VVNGPQSVTATFAVLSPVEFQDELSDGVLTLRLGAANPALRADVDGAAGRVSLAASLGRVLVSGPYTPDTSTATAPVGDLQVDVPGAAFTIVAEGNAPVVGVRGITLGSAPATVKLGEQTILSAQVASPFDVTLAENADGSSTATFTPADLTVGTRFEVLASHGEVHESWMLDDSYAVHVQGGFTEVAKYVGPTWVEYTKLEADAALSVTARDGGSWSATGVACFDDGSPVEAHEHPLLGQFQLVTCQ